MQRWSVRLRRRGSYSTGVDPATSTIYFSTTRTLTADFDIGSHTYRWNGAANGTMFDLSGASGIRLYSSTGLGTVHGNDTARAFTSSTSTAGCTIEGITFSHCIASISSSNIAGTLLGGDVPAQTGGANIVQDCTFTTGGKLEYGGMNHIIRRLTFISTNDTALHEGIAPLDWSKWSENGASGCTVSNITFTNCNTSNAANSDTNVFYCPKRFASKNTYSNFTFSGCNGVCFYLDDMSSNKTATNMIFNDNNGKAFLVGGGKNNVLTGFVDTNSGYASVWDDRGNAENGAGGTHAGAYTNGTWHAGFHNGAGLAVTGATSASPIVITTTSAHSLADGDRVTITGCVGNTTANGNFFAKRTGYSATTFGLYSDVGLTTAVDGSESAPWTSGGKLGWSHVTKSGQENFSMSVVYGENTAITAGGAEPWLATVTSGTAALDYTTWWTNEATWATTGTLGYTRAGTTPAPQDGYGAAVTTHAGVTVL